MSIHLRAVSFNIQHGRTQEEIVDVEELARACTRLRADIMALQEVDVGTPRSGRVDQVSAVADATGLHGVFGMACPIEDGQYGNALFARGSVDDVEVRPLPGSEGREPRSFMLASVTIGGLRTTVAVTHLSVGTDQNVSQLEALLAALSERPHRACCWATSTCYRRRSTHASPAQG